MSWLALSASFQYLCYGSASIINISTLSVRGLTLDIRPQILTTKVDPGVNPFSAEIIKIFLIVVDP